MVDQGLWPSCPQQVSLSAQMHAWPSMARAICCGSAHIAAMMH